MFLPPYLLHVLILVICTESCSICPHGVKQDVIAGYTCEDHEGCVMGNSIDPDTELLFEGDNGQQLGDSLGGCARKAEVVIRVNTSLPIEEGCLFEAGGSKLATGAYIGVVRESCDDSKCKSSTGGDCFFEIGGEKECTGGICRTSFGVPESMHHTEPRATRMVDCAVGFKWQSVGATKPMIGMEFFNAELAEELRAGRLSLNKQIFDSVGIGPQNLTMSSYIKVENDYFRPDGTGSMCCRVEVFHDGEWGTVCGDRWGDPGDMGANKAPEVVCRQLGCSSEGAETKLKFGGGTGKIWLDNVVCDGSEDSLFGCNLGPGPWFEGQAGHDCRYHDASDVGVCCSGCNFLKEQEEPCDYAAVEQQVDTVYRNIGKYTCCPITDESLSLRFTVVSTAAAAVTITIPLHDSRLPQDGQVHEFTMTIKPSTKSIHLAVNGIQVAQGVNYLASLPRPLCMTFQ